MSSTQSFKKNIKEHIYKTNYKAYLYKRIKNELYLSVEKHDFDS